MQLYLVEWALCFEYNNLRLYEDIASLEKLVKQK